MDRYLSSKKPSKKVKKSVDDEFKKEEKEYYTQKGGFFKNVVDLITGETVSNDDFDEEDMPIEQTPRPRRKSLFSNLKSWFFYDGDEAEMIVEGEIEPMVEDDIKEVLKIQNNWMKKLPANTVREFKNSEDYQIYKQTLQKYGLIRQKEDNNQ